MDDFFWSCVDDEAPLGNDNGADVFSFYGEALESNSFDNAESFLDRILKSWGFNFSAWSAGTEEAEELFKKDDYSFEAANDGAIALVFGMIVVNGMATNDAIELTKSAILRELNPIVLKSKWGNPESRKKKL